MPNKVVLIGIAIALLALVGLASISKTSNHLTRPAAASRAVQPDKHSAAYQLAVDDGKAAPSQTTVDQYQTALGKLSPRCSEDQVKLAGEIWASKKDLLAHAITDETNLTLLGHITTALPQGSSTTNCADIMAAYLVQREPAN